MGECHEPVLSGIMAKLERHLKEWHFLLTVAEYDVSHCLLDSPFSGGSFARLPNNRKRGSSKYL
jgi:hypothetical protein